MADNVGDFIVRRLVAWGVRRVYGYPGDGIDGVMGALARARDAIGIVRARHEETCALMACAHAKFTGEVGVCVATSGPGAIHLLNGLYDARLDHQPVVAIVGQAARAALGGDYQQEVDLPALFKDVAGAYVQTVLVPEQARHVVDRALRIAVARRTVTCVVVPSDVQLLDAADPPHAHGTVHSGLGHCEPVVRPREADLDRAAEVLNAGERVALLVGAGALGAAAEVVEVAERLGAGVAKALLGKAALPDDLPFVTGAIGLLGTRASWDLMRGCDTLLIVGSGFPYSEFLPREGQARGVQIDLDPTRLALRYPTEVNLVGDAAATLRALSPRLERKADRRWREQVERSVRDWNETLAERARSDANPVNPQRVFTELSSRLPDGCVVTGDSGTVAGWLARDVRVRAGMKVSLSGGLATMGSAVPYAIAAKLAEPDRAVIALAGDGAMQMNGNAELVTVAERWREWRDPRFVVLVLVNHDLNMVSWEQRVLAGDPKFSAVQDVADFPYARHAGLIGLAGFRVDRPERIGPTWDEALAAGRPAVIEAVVDPDVPLLPPHVTAAQARAFLAAMAKGDPDRGDVLRALYRAMHPGAGRTAP